MDKLELFESIYTESNDKLQESNDTFLDDLAEDFFAEEDKAITDKFGDVE